MPDPLANVSHLSLDIHDHGDMWVGTVEVGYAEGWFRWAIVNEEGDIIQSDQEQREPIGLQADMAVLLTFLLATADQPLAVFNSATTVWAVLHRKALVKALAEL